MTIHARGNENMHFAQHIIIQAQHKRVIIIPATWLGKVL